LEAIRGVEVLRGVLLSGLWHTKAAELRSG
jgi:hypothetical protein